MRTLIIFLLLVQTAFSFPFECPEWDESLLPEECRGTKSFNCLPRCGKYPGDRPDIGAYEWFPNITEEKPWGDWDGVPLTYTPHMDKVNNLRFQGIDGN